MRTFSFVCTILFFFNILSLTSTEKRVRFRRREFVEEQVKRTMNQYMTSLKGEIADVILDELNDFNVQQKYKIDQLEAAFNSLKYSNNQTMRVVYEQSNLVKNLSTIESQIKNLSISLRKILNQTEPSKLPIGRFNRKVYFKHPRRFLSREIYL